jgi:hypothetical protein
MALVLASALLMTLWGRHDPAAGDASGAAAEEADPPEVAIGERLFLETRFAQFFFANSGGDANAMLTAGDPVMDRTQTTQGSLPGPFAGASMNCRSCHLVDEQTGVNRGGNRTYADFARRSPIPAREDGKRQTPRNSPPLVNASLPRPGFLLHFDGEFASGVDLVKGTFTGRNFGWLPTERDRAVAHIAHIIHPAVLCAGRRAAEDHRSIQDSRAPGSGSFSAVPAHGAGGYSRGRPPAVCPLLGAGARREHAQQLATPRGDGAGAERRSGARRVPQVAERGLRVSLITRASAPAIHSQPR